LYWKIHYRTSVYCRSRCLDKPCDFSFELAPVGFGSISDCKYGYIDTSGKIVIKPLFNEARGFADNGLAAVNVGDGRNDKWGYIDTTGNFVIQPQFEWADDFQYGIARVEVEDKWGFINAVSDYVGHATPARLTENYAENNWGRIMNGHAIFDKAVALMGVND